MPVTGFEPVLRCRNCHLKTARLPIPPHGLCVETGQCSRFAVTIKPDGSLNQKPDFNPTAEDAKSAEAGALTRAGLNRYSLRSLRSLR